MWLAGQPRKAGSHVTVQHMRMDAACRMYKWCCMMRQPFIQSLCQPISDCLLKSAINQSSNPCEVPRPLNCNGHKMLRDGRVWGPQECKTGCMGLCTQEQWQTTNLWHRQTPSTKDGSDTFVFQHDPVNWYTGDVHTQQRPPPPKMPNSPVSKNLFDKSTPRKLLRTVTT